jgi:COMC family
MTTSKTSIKKTSDDRKKPASPDVKGGDTGELDEGALNKVVGGSGSLSKATTAGAHFKEGKIEV